MDRWHSGLCWIFNSVCFNINAIQWILNVFVLIQYSLYVFFETFDEITCRLGCTRAACTERETCPAVAGTSLTDGPSMLAQPSIPMLMSGRHDQCWRWLWVDVGIFVFVAAVLYNDISTYELASSCSLMRDIKQWILDLYYFQINTWGHAYASAGNFCLVSSPGSVHNLALTSYLHFVHHSFTHAHSIRNIVEVVLLY